MAPLLSVRDLVTVFESKTRPVQAVDSVSFEIREGEVFGLVGESGCGKSATCRSILRLFAGAPARITGGTIEFAGRDLTCLSEAEMTRVRGREIAMVFQDPMTSLNPTMRVGDQIAEGLIRHESIGRRAARLEAIELLKQVGVPSAEQRLDSWPHEFSGGMRQRVLIAIALACRPKLLIADEPTTALDVTIQDQILKLILRLREQYGMSVLLVTHDLGVVAQTCDRVATMYAGRIVETAETPSLFARPLHPYTIALLNSLPGGKKRSEPLQPIGGAPPNLADPPPGCRFHPRCSIAVEACRSTAPALLPVDAPHRVACLRRGAEPS
ncbi:ABC transporter ATP-binding protein [Rhodospirillaceae bacterium SYSU D60014]|uniref:ABC transporter ATP-binding protein n=1 Tax=Virgifigura deserti TaxID=2268457 RepID=UPI000E6641EE